MPSVEELIKIAEDPAQDIPLKPSVEVESAIVKVALIASSLNSQVLKAAGVHFSQTDPELAEHFAKSVDGEIVFNVKTQYDTDLDWKATDKFLDMRSKHDDCGWED